MADFGITEIALAATAASTALSAGSSLMAGQEKSQAAALEQSQLLGQQQALERQSENAKIAADQAEAKRREELTSNLQTIQSLRAGRGVGELSPTGRAILTGVTDNAEGDLSSERFNILSKSDEARMGAINAGTAAEQAGRRVRSSLLAGYMGAGSAIAGGVLKGVSASKGYYSGTPV